jgi:hypothetical protein
MLAEILSVLFLVGVPIWLVAEYVRHRSRIVLSAGRPVAPPRVGRPVAPDG